MDVLTQELTAHLDEDMQELLELEKEKVSFDLWIMFDSQLWGSLRLNAFHELRTWVWKLVDLLIHRIWTLLAIWPESYERVDLVFEFVCDSLNHIVAIIGVSIEFLGSMLGYQ